MALVHGERDSTVAGTVGGKEQARFTEGLTVEEALVKWAKETPNKTLYTYLNDKGEVPTNVAQKSIAVATYAQFEARTAKLARKMLNDWGLKPGVSRVSRDPEEKK